MGSERGVVGTVKAIHVRQSILAIPRPCNFPRGDFVAKTAANSVAGARRAGCCRLFPKPPFWSLSDGIPDKEIGAAQAHSATASMS